MSKHARINTALQSAYLAFCRMPLMDRERYRVEMCYLRDAIAEHTSSDPEFVQTYTERQARLLKEEGL